MHSCLTNCERWLKVKNSEGIPSEKNRFFPTLLNIVYPDTDYEKNENNGDFSSVDTYVAEMLFQGDTILKPKKQNILLRLN
jgi:hypothetical protein